MDGHRQDEREVREKGETMKKLLVIPVVALALAATAASAPAAVDDVKGPACADITDTSWLYSLDGDTATVDIYLGTASCPSVSYTLWVVDSADDSTPVSSASVPGDGAALSPGLDVVTVNAGVPVADQDGVVCLYATTSVGRHVFDWAPDADASPNCVEVIAGGSGGVSGHN
jgi:hypothetical protein